VAIPLIRVVCIYRDRVILVPYKQNRSRKFDSNDMWLHPKGIRFPVKVTSHHHTEEKHAHSVHVAYTLLVAPHHSIPLVHWKAWRSLQNLTKREKKEGVGQVRHKLFWVLDRFGSPSHYGGTILVQEKTTCMALLFFCTTPSLRWTDMLSAELLAPKCGYLSGFTYMSNG
jgi:hypothetical protein